MKTTVRSSSSIEELETTLDTLHAMFMHVTMEDDPSLFISISHTMEYIQGIIDHNV